MEDKKNGLLKGAGIAYIAGVMSLILALIVLQLAVHGHIAVATDMITYAGFLLFVVSSLVGTGLTVGGTFSDVSVHRLSRLHDPSRDELTRLLVDELSGRELLIYGRRTQVVRKAVLTDWLLNRRLLRERWYVLDSNDNDVTDLTFSDFDGVLRLVFD